MRKLSVFAAAAVLTALAFPALAATTAVDPGRECRATTIVAGDSTAVSDKTAMVMNDSIDMRDATGQGYLGDRPADGMMHPAVFVVMFDDTIGAGAAMVLGHIGDRPADGSVASLGNMYPSIDNAAAFGGLTSTNLAAARAANTT